MAEAGCAPVAGASHVVALLASRGADDLVASKGFVSISQLLAPFTNTTVSVRDPSTGMAVSSKISLDVRDLRKDGFLLSHTVLPHVLHEALRAASSAGIWSVEGSLKQFNDALAQWAEPVDQETFRTYLSCLFFVSTRDENPLASLSQLIQLQHSQQHSSDGISLGPSHCARPLWTTPTTLKHYVIVYEANEEQRSREIFSQMCSTYGIESCSQLRLDGVRTSEGAGDEDGEGDDTPTAAPSAKRSAVSVTIPSLDAEKQWAADHPEDDSAPLVPGARVFAVFQKVFYPALVGERDLLGRYMVEFVEDKIVRPVPPAGVVPLSAVTIDKECLYQSSPDDDPILCRVLKSANAANAKEWQEGDFKLMEMGTDETEHDAKWTMLQLDMATTEWKKYVNAKSKMVTRINTVHSCEEAMKKLKNITDVQQTRDAFESVRRLLSMSKNPPVDEVINCGLIHALVQGLSIQDEKIPYECAWALSIVASATLEHSIKVSEAHATVPLVDLMICSDLILAEQATWAVANIARVSSPPFRDDSILSNCARALLMLCEKRETLSTTFVRTLAWTFSNICRHSHPYASRQVLKVLSQGLFLLMQHKDYKVRQDACWAVSYLTDGPDEQITLAREAGIMPLVYKHLTSEDDGLVAPALRVLGNMATGNDSLTQTVIELGTLKALPAVARKAKSSSIVKECCWLISNVIAGTQHQIQAVLDSGLLPWIVEKLEQGDIHAQNECLKVFRIITKRGSPAQLAKLVRCRPCAAALRAAFALGSSRVAFETLEGIDRCITRAFLLPNKDLVMAMWSSMRQPLALFSPFSEVGHKSRVISERLQDLFFFQIKFL